MVVITVLAYVINHKDQCLLNFDARDIFPRVYLCQNDMFNETSGKLKLYFQKNSNYPCQLVKINATNLTADFPFSDHLFLYDGSVDFVDVDERPVNTITSLLISGWTMKEYTKNRKDIGGKLCDKTHEVALTWFRKEVRKSAISWQNLF